MNRLCFVSGYSFEGRHVESESWGCPKRYDKSQNEQDQSCNREWIRPPVHEFTKLKRHVEYNIRRMMGENECDAAAAVVKNMKNFETTKKLF